MVSCDALTIRAEEFWVRLWQLQPSRHSAVRTARLILQADFAGDSRIYRWFDKSLIMKNELLANFTQLVGSSLL